MDTDKVYIYIFCNYINNHAVYICISFYIVTLYFKDPLFSFTSSLLACILLSYWLFTVLIIIHIIA